jgi:hypothetical protein
MKHLKIFLASSIVEFADDRISLKNFIRQMENVLIDHGIYLRMFICEYADNAVADERKQNEFLREIDDSDIFLILAGQNLGSYTLEEYQYAVAVYERRNDGLPKILTAFKTCDEVGQSIEDFSAMLSANTERVDFGEIPELKAALAGIIGTLLPGGILRVENGKITVAGKTIKLWI